MINDSQKGSTLKDLQQKIGERFDERFVNPENTGYRVGQEFLGAVESFISSEFEKALRKLAEAVRVKKGPYKSRLFQNRNLIDYCGTCEQAWEYCSCSARNTGFNAAVTEQEEKVKRFFD